MQRQTMGDYQTELPRLLHDAGLDTDIGRIEIDADTLETVVLDLIRAWEASDPHPGAPA